MADPKIKYDIEADVKGNASIQQLEGSLLALADTLEGDLKTQATTAAAALAALGAKQDAVANFAALRRETVALSSAMDAAAQKVDAIGAELPQAAAATARFTDAETKARAAVASAKGDLDEQRQALVKLRDEFTGAARNSDQFKEAEAQLRTTLKDLRANLADKKQELTAAATATKQAERNEKELTTAYKNSVTSAREISTTLGAKNRALETSRGAMEAVGIATRNLAETERSLDAAVAAVKQEVLGLVPAYRAAQQASDASTQKQVQNQKTLRDGMTSISTQLNRIQQIATVALGGSYAGGLLKDVAETADTFKNLEARIKLVTGEGENFAAGFEGVTEIALRTNSALDSTATLFARLAKVGQEAGLGAQAAQQQALGIAETINQAVQLGGATAEASNAAVIQLIQGLQSGVLRGEEFNAVMEQAPRLAQALASGLGATTGELRKMANQGQLTSDVVIKALSNQSAAVAAEFDKLPATVGRALQNLSTQWTLYVGAADNGMASSANAARLIDALSKNLDTLISLLYGAGKAFAAIKIAGLAADLYKYVAGTVAATSSVQANTAALAANSAAHVANAAAARTSAAAGAGGAAAVAAGTTRIAAAGSVLGRFSALLGPVGIGLAVLGPEIGNIGRWLGEAAARAMGYGKAIQEAETRTRAQAEASKAAAEIQRVQNQLLQEAKDRQFDLSKAAAGLIGKFDGLKKAGDSAAEAVAKIGKDFDLSTLPGIRDAAGVLDRLAADGKLTAAEFQAAWANALNGKDLAVFETTARAAFAGTRREGELLTQMLDAGLRESIKRAGLDFDSLKGGISKVAQSAINDTEAIINGLDRLGKQGVDTSRALVASISKGIDTADTQQALNLVKGQIESLRKTLGDKVADGFLDQVTVKSLELKDALDKALPGINSIREAYKQLGVQAPEDLRRIAAANKSAWEIIKNDGKAGSDTLKTAFEAYAQSAIASAGNIGSASRAVTEAVLRTEGAVKGLDVTFDAHGKLVVRSQNEARQAVEQTTAAVGQQISETERLIQAEEKRLELAGRGADLERRRLGVDKNGFSTDKNGNTFEAGSDVSTLTGIAAFLKAAGVDDDKAARSLAREFADSQGNVQYMDNPGQRKYGGDTISMALLKAAETYTFGIGGGSPQDPSTIPKPQTRNITVNLSSGGSTTAINVASDADAESLGNFLKTLENASRRSA